MHLQYFYGSTLPMFVLMPSIKEPYSPSAPLNTLSKHSKFLLTVFLPKTVLTTNPYLKAVSTASRKSLSEEKKSRSCTFCPPMAIQQVAKRGSAHRPLSFSGDPESELWVLGLCTDISMQVSKTGPCWQNTPTESTNGIVGCSCLKQRKLTAMCSA